jgi:hypothetical protein
MARAGKLAHAVVALDQVPGGYGDAFAVKLTESSMTPGRVG